MNKYELALVVSAKVEDEVMPPSRRQKSISLLLAERLQTSMNGARKNLLMKFRRWVKAFITLFSSTLSQVLRLNWNRDFALWTTCSDTYA